MVFVFKDKGLIIRTKLVSHFVAFATRLDKAEVSGFQCFV